MIYICNIFISVFRFQKAMSWMIWYNQIKFFINLEKNQIIVLLLNMFHMLVCEKEYIYQIL